MIGVERFFFSSFLHLSFSTFLRYNTPIVRDLLEFLWCIECCFCSSDTAGGEMRASYDY